MMIFTGWLEDVTLRYSLGFSLIHLIVCVVGLNITMIVWSTISDFLYARKK